MKRVVLFLLLAASWSVSAQSVSLNPTISPALFHYNDQVTITYDVTGTSLASLSSAWLWMWIPNSSPTDAKSNVNPASGNTSLTNLAMCTKSVVNGKTLFSLTVTPSTLFTFDISAKTQLGMLLKGNDWSNGQTTDYVTNFLIGSNFQTTLTSPALNPLFANNGDVVSIQASASAASKFLLTVNNVRTDSVASATNYQYSLNVASSPSSYRCRIIVTNGTTIDTLSFAVLLTQSSPTAKRPAGIIDGINYSGDATSVTLGFWAPNKSSVYAVGDFSNWEVDPKYLMNRDGEHFWIQLSGLTPGKEYGYQYLVNDTLKIADPYADKILSYPDDQKIPAATYPGLKAYPTKAINNQWYYNRVSVFQTAQTPYAWKTASYTKPAKEKLVIYELLIRDFFDKSNRNFQHLIDTISYFKRLGVNAIELMPVAEFNGEIGWGYNPTFMFAVQKYYGTKNKLKEFVDVCHANGIAVIMDIVLNHQDLPNSYAMLDYNFATGKPKSSNKWFNVDATHPYSVFNDLNHASAYTQRYVDTINYYWLKEFKIDGFRYDLSKGFTQTQSGSNVGLWGQYDQSRINILERMADQIWKNFPDAYIILEHFADNSEETVLANYRVAEGKGMMLWENFNYAYSQNTMGYSSGSDISAMFYGNKGWTAPRAVGYMESHDEERVMYRNLNFGNASGSYSAKTLSTALNRVKAASLLFYSIPGPKMLWEFGELGYDQSINTCVNLSVNDSCRLTPKPVLWTSYLADQGRKSLSSFTSDLLRLRRSYTLFSQTGNATISNSSLVQQIVLKNTPYTATPTDSTQMNAAIIANMDVTSRDATLTFPHSGTWYEYYSGTSISGSGISATLNPGEYRLYTDVPLKKSSTVTGVEPGIDHDVVVYPVPAQGHLHIASGEKVEAVQLRSLTGAAIPLASAGQDSWDVGGVTSGLYIAEISTASGVTRRKVVIKQ